MEEVWGIFGSGMVGIGVFRVCVGTGIAERADRKCCSVDNWASAPEDSHALLFPLAGAPNGGLNVGTEAPTP